MTKGKRVIWIIPVILILLLGTAVLIYSSIRDAEFSFAREVSEVERAQRLSLVAQAEAWLGTQGGSPEHLQILEIYNTHQPLAQGYTVKEEDAWCATFVSACAIQLEWTDIIPTECGCQRQIGLWQDMGRWEESDDYVPLPGDIIYYASAGPLTGDNTAWSDHVGIVMGTWRNYIKVIEGNCDDRVACRYIPMDDSTIRGYAIPDYNK